jgi:hypothetical protein
MKKRYPKKKEKKRETPPLMMPSIDHHNARFLVASPEPVSKNNSSQHHVVFFFIYGQVWTGMDQKKMWRAGEKKGLEMGGWLTLLNIALECWQVGPGM